MTDDLPECETHKHLPVRLEKIKAFHAETNFLTPQDIEYLIEQAEWAIDLDRAGQNLKNAAQVYVAELEGIIEQQDAKIRRLTGEEK